MKSRKTQENSIKTGLIVIWKCDSIIILNILILLPKIVVSDDTHYKDMLFGGRAAGMGGTYIAISDDTAGLVVYFFRNIELKSVIPDVQT